MFGKKQTLTFDVQGMTCGHCQATVEDALKGVSGVKRVTVTLEPGRAEVMAREGVDADALVKAIETAGYEARLAR